MGGGGIPAPGPSARSGHTDAMSRVTHLDDSLPEDVEAAAFVLSSRLRIGVLHELRRRPCTTTDLMRSLGVADRSTMTTNLRVLEEHGVLTGTPPRDSRPGRAITWQANPARITELTLALNRHITARR